MAQSATTTNQANLLKSLYGDKVAWPAYKRSRFLAGVRKDTKFGGDGRYVNVTCGPSGSGSSDFNEALANQRATTEVRFFVTHKKEYHIISIDGDAIARSEGDKNAMLQVVKQQTDKARYAFGRALAARAWGDNGGALGVIGSATTLASTSIDLATPADVVRFEPGMYLQFSSDAGNGASPAGTLDSGAKLRVTAVNRKFGLTTDHITVSANLNTISGMTVGYHIFRAGDYANSMTGMRGWCPHTDPSAGESFFSVDRTLNDIARQSGIRVSGSGGTKEETLIDASAAAHMNGFETEVVYTNPLDYRDLLKEVSSKVYVDVNTRVPGISFKALELQGNTGPMAIISEPDVPKGYFWMINPDMVHLRTAGDCPRMIKWDGSRGMFQQSPTEDGMQGRLGAYGNFFHDNPGETVIGTW